jgi:hypothetical protein
MRSRNHPGVALAMVLMSRLGARGMRERPPNTEVGVGGEAKQEFPVPLGLV